MVPLSFGCGSAVLAAIATLAPSRAARSAIASPIPRLAPDMNSVLPLSDVIGRPPVGGAVNPTPIPEAGNSALGVNVLLPGRLRAAGSRVGSAEQSFRRHGDRIGGSLPHRLDHTMTFGAERSQSIIGKASLDPHFVR